MTIHDIHTHRLVSGAIVAVEPPAALHDGYLYAAGLHPWHINGSEDLAMLEAMCGECRVAAIGECGLDRICTTPMDLQRSIFSRHIEISERLGKPLIIHCVRAFDVLLAMHRESCPHQQWIIHGFRQKPALASQLLEKGIALSLGPRFNAETARIIPADRLFIETDDDPSASIMQVAAAVAEARHTTAGSILDQVAANADRICRI